MFKNFILKREIKSRVKINQTLCSHNYHQVDWWYHWFNDERTVHILYCPLCDKKIKVIDTKKTIILNSQKVRKEYREEVIETW